MKSLLVVVFSVIASLAAQKPLTCTTQIGGPVCKGGGVCVNLTWNADTDSTFGPAVSYNLARGQTSGGETPLTTSTTNSYQDNAIPAGATVLYYTVAAVFAGGQVSAASSEACAQIPAPPQAPTGLVATPQ